MSLMENRSEVDDFILKGLTDDPELQVLLCIMFTFIYLITLVGNQGMIALISWDSHLQTPMYFFLSNLSLLDFGYYSGLTHKVMAALLTGDKEISHTACATQFFFLGAFTATENLLLACTVYNCHAALCMSLHYTTTVTSTLCAQVASDSYICAFLIISIFIGNLFTLSICRSNIVQQFFCDVPPLLVLSCSDIHIIELILFILGPITTFSPFLVIFISYLLIFITVLKNHSVEGLQKAISTCASHLKAVSIFYGTIIFMYFQTRSSHAKDIDKMMSVFYTMIIAMLNSLVYSLRNNAVKKAFQKVKRG